MSPFRPFLAALSACLGTLFVPLARLDACTLWGAAGEIAAGGTIVLKNRDWKPDHTQVLRMRRGESGYAYFGLCTVYEGRNTEGLAAGVNERGLTAFTAAASTIPSDMWKHDRVRRQFLAMLLTDFASCDEVLARKDEIFPSLRPAFIMIADRDKILMVEIGLKGKHALKIVENGSVAHSNHFLDPSLEEFNFTLGEGTLTRCARIEHLLGAMPRPFTTETFAQMSKDQHAGPDHSLWRTGKTARTLSSWIVESPAQGAQRLRVLTANPGEPEQIHAFVLDEAFWNESR